MRQFDERLGLLSTVQKKTDYKSTSRQENVPESVERDRSA
jgi:hypothetical protein